MFDNIDTSSLDGIAWALFSLVIFVTIIAVVPLVILERLGISKKVINFLVGPIILGGFALWIYGMFYLDLQRLFI
ncbi:hypothetical protein FZC78_19235 [Rossellomorea vietnamensis]|uniref:Uncharacterized protein n=1 Tax=Rossellomorea vietnamensis TaxID=218284 RepID=A0A5D4NKA2_9BACI|nr:hypothetical protein [Rossellomorea vietnamensis]TYS14289.1 hypothetical protein FZC78_19235 [Rossellomorea vietnamensis]